MTEKRNAIEQQTLLQVAQVQTLDYCQVRCDNERIMVRTHAGDELEFDPANNATQLVALIKRYFVRTEFQGAGVFARARCYIDDQLVFTPEVFHISYEWSVLRAIAELDGEIKAHLTAKKTV